MSARRADTLHTPTGIASQETPTQAGPSVRVSVVIPALREAANVGGAVASAWASGAESVVVVDGESDDGTAEAARAAGAIVVVSPRGRATQMNAGAKAAVSLAPGDGRVDVLCFLHADTRLPARATSAIASAVALGAEAGVFHLRFSPSSPLLRLYECLARLPVAALTFGDRSLWVRRDVFEEAGGFAELPIFEDVDMARRLARRRSLARLAVPVTTSARRFVASGTLRQQVHNAALWLAYMMGIDPVRIARVYRYEASR